VRRPPLAGYAQSASGLRELGSARGHGPTGNYLVATAVIIAVILYGSLYPFSFEQPDDGIGPVSNLLRSWAEPPHRGDFVANILFYLPLGFFEVLAIVRGCGLLTGIVLVTVAGRYSAPRWSWRNITSLDE
jgi:hypothetical protein